MSELDEIARRRASLVVDQGHGDQEQHIHRKRHKDQRIKVIDRAVANPGVPDRFHAALDQLVGFIARRSRLRAASRWTTTKGPMAKTKPPKQKVAM